MCDTSGKVGEMGGKVGEMGVKWCEMGEMGVECGEVCVCVDLVGNVERMYIRGAEEGDG